MPVAPLGHSRRGRTAIKFQRMRDLREDRDMTQQAVACFVLGVPLVGWMQKNPALREFFAKLR